MSTGWIDLYNFLKKNGIFADRDDVEFFPELPVEKPEDGKKESAHRESVWGEDIIVMDPNFPDRLFLGKNGKLVIKSPILDFKRHPDYLYAWIRLNETICFYEHGYEPVKFQENLKEGEEYKHRYYKNGYYHDNGFTLCKKKVGWNGISRLSEFSFIKGEMDRYDEEKVMEIVRNIDELTCLLSNLKK